LPARAGTDHEIVRSTRDRLDEPRYERWNVATIAIEKHYNIFLRLRDRNRASACRARSTVTARRSYDARAGFTRSLGCPIGAAVIHDNHLAGHAGREAFADDATDWFLLV
jgi:hypothetical protein